MKSGVAAAKELPRMTNRRLILHFDVNKTIIMKDSSKSLTSVYFAVIKDLHSFFFPIDKSNCNQGCMGSRSSEE